jgi:hypothetical protein
MSIINNNNQLLFSNYSGDYNPVHIDPIYARRSMYGQQVVHGINTFLLALEFFCEKTNSILNFRSIEVKFLKPVFLNEEFDIKIISNIKNDVLIHVIVNNSICTKINFKYSELAKLINYNLFVNRPIKTKPELFDFKNNKIHKGELNIVYDKQDLINIYPNLVLKLDNYQLGVLLTLTRLVGMKCPGLNSLFSSFKLNFKNKLESDFMINYSLEKYDERFSLYNIKIHSKNFDGSIIAFNRPIPVSQPSYLSLKPIVKSNEFKNQRALIIGGSRGLGEITAKLLAIGGAKVVITYNKGLADSNLIVDEITQNGGNCKTIHLNVLKNDFKNFDSLGAIQKPTHIYYYATPFIFSGTKGSYSEKLFLNFSKYYISGFYNLVKYFFKKNTLNFFYPSTVALDDFSGNMLEYTLAKSSGEKLCEFLKFRFPKTNIYKTKLPRLATDQTVSLFPVKNENPENIILNHLRKFNIIHG